MLKKYQKRKIKELIAVIYARFSCDKQRDESIEDQLRVCMEYAREHGITVVGQYCDYALSGRNDHRPQFLKMIEDSKSGAFNTVLLWKMDRFARNRWDSAIYKKELYMNGVSVISATEPIPEGGGGIIMESIYDGMAEMYSVQISQNVKRAARGNALKNKSNGGYTLFGYKVNPITRQYELDEVTAPIAEEIFNRAAAGKSYKSIIQYAKSLGFNFGYCKLSTMLKNERYTGVYIYDGIRNEGGMPAIVSKTKFDIIQRIFADNSRRQRSANVKYLFSKRCFCGKCGSTITGEYAKNSKGSIYYYYTCQGRKMYHSCDMKRLRADIVETAATQVIAGLLTDDELMHYFIDSAIKAQNNATQDNVELKIAKSKLTEVQTKKANLLDAIEQGIFSSSTAIRLKELDDEELTLKSTIKRLAPNGTQKLTENQFEYFLKNFNKSKLKSEIFVKSLFQELISRVFLFEDHITLIYNLKNEIPEEYSLEQIEKIEQLQKPLVMQVLDNKKSPEHKCSRHYGLAPRVGLEPTTP